MGSVCSGSFRLVALEGPASSRSLYYPNKRVIIATPFTPQCCSLSVGGSRMPLKHGLAQLCPFSLGGLDAV